MLTIRVNFGATISILYFIHIEEHGLIAAVVGFVDLTILLSVDSDTGVK